MHPMRKQFTSAWENVVHMHLERIKETSGRVPDLSPIRNIILKRSFADDESYLRDKLRGVQQRSLLRMRHIMDGERFGTTTSQLMQQMQ